MWNDSCLHAPGCRVPGRRVCRSPRDLCSWCGRATAGSEFSRALEVTREALRMMLRRLAKLATTLGLSALAAIGMNTEPAHALSLLGQEVTGEFLLNPVTPSSTNFFDPENGKVPDFTYGNSLNVPGNGTNIVPIRDDLIEFGYQGSTSRFEANFTGAGGFTLTATSVPFTNGATTQFSSPGLAGLTFTMVGPAAPSNACSFATSF